MFDFHMFENRQESKTTLVEQSLSNKIVRNLLFEPVNCREWHFVIGGKKWQNISFKIYYESNRGWQRGFFLSRFTFEERLWKRFHFNCQSEEVVVVYTKKSISGIWRIFHLPDNTHFIFPIYLSILQFVIPTEIYVRLWEGQFLKELGYERDNFWSIHNKP
jgi:hypothetical protein